MHVVIPVDERMTNGALKEKIISEMQNCGLENIYKFILRGYRDVDILFELESVKNLGNIIEIVDETKPSYDLEKLMEKNRGNLLEKYIESFKDCEDGSIEQLALYEGVQALMETKRG